MQLLSNDLVDFMKKHLKPKGRNPVHSIQVYLSNADTVIHEAVGFSDGKNEKANKDNQFKIASIAKIMTATVILQMQEEGKLNIDDTVADFLSSLKFARVNELHYVNGKPYGEKITIRHLLQHKSGIADIFTDAAFRFYVFTFLHRQMEWNPEKLMDRYYLYNLQHKAHSIPGDGFYYSDVNYFLLGLIIEKLSRQTLAKQFRSRIFDPLQMTDTYFEYYEPPRGNGKLAHSFLGKLDITKNFNTSYDWAGGGVVSTTRDLALFLTALFNGKLLGKKSTLEEMIAVIPHTTPSGRVSY